jgi:hypothetical protein
MARRSRSAARRPVNGVPFAPDAGAVRPAGRPGDSISIASRNGERKWPAGC